MKKFEIITIISLIAGIIFGLFITKARADDGRFKELYKYGMNNFEGNISVLEDTRYKSICYVYDGYNSGGISCIPKKELGLK